MQKKIYTSHGKIQGMGLFLVLILLPVLVLRWKVIRAAGMLASLHMFPYWYNLPSVMSVDGLISHFDVAIILVWVGPETLAIRVANFDGFLSGATTDLDMRLISVRIGPWALDIL